MASLSRIALCVAASFSTALTLPLRAIAADSHPISTLDTSSTSSTAVAPGEMEQLVAPIALYPDALLSQVLMASTYPLEVVEAARWQKDHPDLKGDELDTALQSQDWDPSVKSLLSFPTVLEMMNDRISWTSRLGDTFLARQDAVMDTVQQMRARAQANGNLETSDRQKVVVSSEQGSKTIIQIEPAQPDVVYVPTYNPTVVYGPWLYPAYTPFYWYPPGYAYAGLAFSFGAGLIVGHALWGGYDWHRHRVNIVNAHYYNSFNHTHFAGGHWTHNPVHRRGVFYRDHATAQHFNHGGSDGRRFASREAYRARAEAGRANLHSVDRSSFSGRAGSAGRSDRSPGEGWHGRGGDSDHRWSGSGSRGADRQGGASNGTSRPSSYGSNRPSRTPDGAAPTARPSSPGADRGSSSRGSESRSAGSSRQGGEARTTNRPSVSGGSSFAGADRGGSRGPSARSGGGERSFGGGGRGQRESGGGGGGHSGGGGGGGHHRG